MSDEGGAGVAAKEWDGSVLDPDGTIRFEAGGALSRGAARR